MSKVACTGTSRSGFLDTVRQGSDRVSDTVRQGVGHAGDYQHLRTPSVRSSGQVFGQLAAPDGSPLRMSNPYPLPGQDSGPVRQEEDCGHRRNPAVRSSGRDVGQGDSTRRVAVESVRPGVRSVGQGEDCRHLNDRGRGPFDPSTDTAYYGSVTF